MTSRIASRVAHVPLVWPTTPALGRHAVAGLRPAALLGGSSLLFSTSTSSAAAQSSPESPSPAPSPNVVPPPTAADRASSPPTPTSSASAATMTTPSSGLHPTSSSISIAAANPPDTTLPPPLLLPEPRAKTGASAMRHAFATGKAYLTFYKTGLGQIYTNTRLVNALRAASPIRDPDASGSSILSSSPDLATAPGSPSSSSSSFSPAQERPLPPSPGTRSATLLLSRWRHDVRRVPVFALLLLVCGEFTPLVVLALPTLVPLTCRIPAQLARLAAAQDARRAASFADLRAHHALRTPASSTLGSAQGTGTATPQAERLAASDAAPGLAAAHIARSLGLVTPRLPTFALSALAPARARTRVRQIAADDALLRQAGGIPALNDHREVLAACQDRGIDTTATAAGAAPVVPAPTDSDLRAVLGRWLALSTPQGLIADRDEEAARRVCYLLTRRPHEWPTTPDFAPPKFDFGG